MNLQSLLLFFQNRTSLAVIALLVLVFAVASCETQDPYAIYNRPLYDAEEKKIADEKDIRLYFRRNNIDTTSANLVRTESGLYYLKKKEGTGDKLKVGDRVEVQYSGTFLWGQQFDENFNKGTVFTVHIGTTGVIKGWTEGLQLMKPEEEGTLFIPTHLAYNDRYDQRPVAHQVLIFDMKIVRKK